MAEATTSRLRGGLVTYIAYNSAFDPLVESQVVAYLRRLHSEFGIRFLLLTFEPANSPAHVQGTASALSQRLAQEGIRWIPLRYHQRPSLLASLWDIAVGTIRVVREAKRERPVLIHARSDVAAAQAWLAHLFLRVPFVFDCRGLLADEYAEAGHWSYSSVNYRLTRWAENALLGAATHVVVLTQALRRTLLRGGSGLPRVDDAHVTTIPCCVDLERFTAPVAHGSPRPERLTLVYAGSVGTRNLLPEMLRFVDVARRFIPSLRFLVLNLGQHDLVHREVARAGLTDVCEVRTASTAEIPALLRESDAGISFVRPSFATSATSPTKIGEYLAAGLPVVANAGVGDVESLLEGVGVVVADFSDESLGRAAQELLELAGKPSSAAAASRARAERDLSLAEGARRYHATYTASLSEPRP